MRGAARLVGILLCILGQLDAADAKKAPPSAAAKDHAAQLAEQGLAALKQNQFEAAHQAFVDGFRAAPQPKWLFHLAQVLHAQKKHVEAKDLLRRFLADSTVDAEDPLRKEAQTLLSSIPVEDAGELQVNGPRGARVTVDGRFVGQLPLPMALLVPTGSHRVETELDKWQAGSDVKTRLGRQVELRFKLGSDVAVVSLPPAVLLIDKTPNPQNAEFLNKKLQSAVGRESYAIVPKNAVETYANRLVACLHEPACLRQAGQLLSIEFALWAEASPNGNGWKAEVALRDTSSGTDLGKRSVQCETCSFEAFSGKIAEAAGALFTTALGRDRGDVEISTNPDGANVFLNGIKLGQSPMKLTLFAGQYDLRLQKSGFVEHTQPLEIHDTSTQTVTVSLLDRDAQNEPAPIQRVAKPQIISGKRPMWRWIAGGTAVGAGAILVGFGASALVQNGTTLDGVCPTGNQCQFNTLTPGIALTATGGALLIAGSILWAWPLPKKTVVE